MPDNDILQGFQAGAAVASDRANRALRMQQLQSEAAHRKMEEQRSVQLMALKMQENELAIQFRADMAKGMAAFEDAVSPTITVPMMGQEGIGDMAPPVMTVDNPNPMRKIDAAMRFVAPVIAKYQPDKAGAFVNDLLLNEVRAQNESNEALRLQQQNENYEPTAGVVTTPSGKRIEYFKTSPRSAQAVIDPTIESVTDPVSGKQVPILRTGTSGAKSIPQDIGARQQESFRRTQQAEQLRFIKDNSAKTYAELFANSPIDPDTGMPAPTPEAIATAAKSAGFQGGTLGQMEQQNISAENLVQVGKELFPLLTKENVGVRGFARRWGARLGLEDMPGFKDASNAEQAATLGRVFVASIFRTLRSDSNINEREVRALEAAAPDPAKIITQPEVLKAQMSALLRNAAEKSRGNAIRMGRDVSPFFLTRDEIVAQGQAGRLTTEQAAELLNNSAWKLIEALEVK